MGFLSVLSFAHKLAGERLQPGDSAVDATAGTGADTLFLAKACGPRGSVFSFDIQAEALALTQARLDKEASAPLSPVTLLESSHADMETALPPEVRGKLGAVMFNLGYLPAQGADPAVITHTESTLKALNAAVRLLKPRGLLTVVLYPGHPGGDEEAAAVEAWAAALPQSAGQAMLYRQPQKPASPYLIAVEKKQSKEGDNDAS
ncbi:MULTISPECIES: class I SAM-dependent methyltransferase [Paenibacillus]|uniref:SAM-dependent methyltransferase n=1 Tax=Paenibacillus vini TaxID=1476024 RepID=A0ABQ4MG09_9BACL|nr:MULTISPECIES: class I SAM-dependent methyltransferase [Paenibacillus]MBQ4899502.1 methyltransferase domain-containing protein [Paenibacillus sp. Marseille-P2973]MDN4068443.1 class I SAM-dependent methyltransferase [Paenibacillus vini]GIP54931.1 SAM-dependent methyltransferase [Paenibacillus vini]